MSFDRVTRGTARPDARVVRATVLAVAVVIAVGCSRASKEVGSIRQAFAQKNYEETMIRCEHALRHNVRDGEVYYYYGLALIELGRDYESFRRFHEAVSADSALAPRIAARLFNKGREALDKGEKRKAAGRLKQAVEFQPELELGAYGYAVADVYFAEKEFARAAEMYRMTVKAHPDTAVAERAYFNLAECYLAMSDSTTAVETFAEELELFPKSALSGRARYEMANLIYERARSEFGRGNYEDVVEEIDALLEWTENNSLVQRARFLLGESYERMGDYQSAYEQYKAIIDKDRGASGRIVERARDKINAFRDSGLI